MAIKVVVRHFHAGNDPDFSARGTSVYATEAAVYDTENHEYVSDGFWAFCSPRDNPSRKLGRHIALERLYRIHPEFRPTESRLAAVLISAEARDIQ